MKILLLVVPLIGALNAWLIVTLLYKMLFWPKEPLILPFGVQLRGLLPQKKEELAAGISEIVETQFHFAVTDEGGLSPEILNKVTDSVAAAARDHIYQRTPVMIPRPLKIKVADLVEGFIKKEMPEYAYSLTKSIKSHDVTGEISVWAQGKINCFDLDEMELKLKHSRQAFYIKAGAVGIGVISGLFQLLLIAVIWS